MFGYVDFAVGAAFVNVGAGYYCYWCGQDEEGPVEAGATFRIQKVAR